VSEAINFTTQTFELELPETVVYVDGVIVHEFEKDVMQLKVPLIYPGETDVDVSVTLELTHAVGLGEIVKELVGLSPIVIGSTIELAGPHGLLATHLM